MWWPKTWRDLKQRKRLIENKIERDQIVSPIKLESSVSLRWEQLISQ